MLRTIAAFACLMFMGAGCRGVRDVFQSPPSCPDICAAVCAGRPEPFSPPECPIPSCACPARSPSPVDAVNIFACTDDDDCVYADRSVCPNTNRQNIVAINKRHLDAYMSLQPSRDGVACIEIWAGYEKPPTCVGGQCVVAGD